MARAGRRSEPKSTDSIDMTRWAPDGSRKRYLATKPTSSPMGPPKSRGPGARPRRPRGGRTAGRFVMAARVRADRQWPKARKAGRHGGSKEARSFPCARIHPPEETVGKDEAKEANTRSWSGRGITPRKRGQLLRRRQIDLPERRRRRDPTVSSPSRRRAPRVLRGVRSVPHRPSPDDGRRASIPPG